MQNIKCKQIKLNIYNLIFTIYVYKSMLYCKCTDSIGKETCKVSNIYIFTIITVYIVLFIKFYLLGLVVVQVT